MDPTKRSFHEYINVRIIFKKKCGKAQTNSIPLDFHINDAAVERLSESSKMFAIMRMCPFLRFVYIHYSLFEMSSNFTETQIFIFITLT